jgi:phenylacetate-CoA ligase
VQTSGAERLRVTPSAFLLRMFAQHGPGFDAAARARIGRDFRTRLGHAVRVRVEEVAANAPGASGKFRYVVSQVKPFETAAEDIVHA